jgi:meso-butanediol dehydrogenase / (S,S)-butanediol dehydrogenase / diacetyl reductase
MGEGRLEGKVALISGTASGQGRAAALRFTAEGALVVACDVNADGARETVSLVEAAGGAMTSMEPVDLGDPDAAHRWVEDAAAVHGRIDILYNNASVARMGTVPDMTIEDWQFTIRNEIDLVFYTTKYAWPHLAERGGVIVNVASAAGWVGSRVAPIVAHAAAKGAILAMTRQMAVEGAAHGIRVVSISPGAITTPATAVLFDNPETSDMLIGNSLIRRAGQPDEVVNLAVFLTSDEASYVTGADFVVDGGLLAS